MVIVHHVSSPFLEEKREPPARFAEAFFVPSGAMGEEAKQHVSPDDSPCAWFSPNTFKYGRNVRRFFPSGKYEDIPGHIKQKRNEC